MAETDTEKSHAEGGVDDATKRSNWVKEIINVAWYIQIAVVILLFLLWVLAGMPG
jgi:hypothetical protein